MPDDVQLLMDYARRGDVSSLSALVSRHGVWLTAFLRGLLPDRSEADDAFQDVWMRVIRAAPDFRGGNLRAWMARIARTVALDRHRKAGRMVSLDDPDADGVSAIEELPAEGPAPNAAFEHQATAAEIRAAVQALPAGPRQVLLLRIEAELSFREIADELGLPLGTTLTWMRTATQFLKKNLGGRA